MSSNPRSVRLEDQTEEKVKVYLENNPIGWAKLVNLAVEKFISEPQTIELKPVDHDVFMNAVGKVMKKHKHAMDKLK